MAIGFRAAGAVGSRASGTTAVTVGVPAGTASGDLLLLIATASNNQTCSASGYTSAGTSSVWGAPGNYFSVLLWKIAGSSEGSASVNTPSASALEAVMIGFTGVDNSTPFDVNAVWAAASGTSPINVAGITTVTANAWWGIFAADDTGSSLTASSVPSGWTQRSLSNATVLARYACDTVLVASAGAQAATTFTKAAGNVIHVGFALRESGASPPSTFVPQAIIIG